MSNQYLIDYENVHEAGLCGIKALTSEDSVYIFHTSNADRITLSCLDDVAAWVKVILVPPGKQSLDMHLGSFLGFIIGKEENPDTQYVIISKDGDYRWLSDFWNKSYQFKDKVACAQNIWSSLHLPCYPEDPPLDDSYAAEMTDIREFIRKTITRYGVTWVNGLPCMLVSELCTRLNCLAVYNSARRKIGKKPMQFLREEFQDMLQIKKQYAQDWAFLLADCGQLSSSDEPEINMQTEAADSAEDMKCIADTNEPIKDDEAQDAVSAAGEPAPKQIESKAEEIISETKAPDTNDNTDTFASVPEDISKEQEMSETEQTDASPEDNGSDCSAYISAAVDLFHASDCKEAMTEDGHLRASVLRDMLLAYPEFRNEMRKSGLKPIAYMQQLFDGRIDIYRSKGIYWARLSDSPVSDPSKSGKELSEDGREDTLAQRKKNYYEKAFSNIQNRLCEAGLDQAVADEITNIVMRSNAAVEPRKVIHTLLCQRFGKKTGAKYYRQTVKYAFTG